MIENLLLYKPACSGCAIQVIPATRRGRTFEPVNAGEHDQISNERIPPIPSLCLNCQNSLFGEAKKLFPANDSNPFWLAASLPKRIERLKEMANSLVADQDYKEHPYEVE